MAPHADARAGPRQEYYWSPDEEPHAARRKAILKKYPEVSKLMGPEPRTKYIVAALVVLQLALAVGLRRASWPVYLATAYVVGATITHALFLAIHELAHNLGAKKPAHNRYISMVANLPILFPYCVTFRQYHLEHHKNQGVDGVDVDIPARAEAALFQGRLGKACWCVAQILFYALRPMCLRRQDLSAMHALNFAVQLSFDYALYQACGLAPFGYLLLCVLLAGSLHPTAGHFIAEHFVLTEGQETYSYYGPLNLVTFNVGYHNEHHDFPYVAWSRLPELRKMAPEFYDGLATYDSWSKVIWDFIARDDVSPWSRVKRTKLAKED